MEIIFWIVLEKILETAKFLLVQQLMMQLRYTVEEVAS